MDANVSRLYLNTVSAFGAGYNHTTSGSYAYSVQSNNVCGGAGAISSAITTLNLSNYVNSTDLTLSFWYLEHSVTYLPHTPDKVWIRGNNTATWIQAYDLDANHAAVNVWKNATGIDVSGLLKANSQSVSSTFQIKFTHQEDYYWGCGGETFILDDINVSGTVPVNDDGGIFAVTAPVSPFMTGSNAIWVTLKNYGLNTLTKDTIKWKVNGVAQTPYYWTGSLAPLATTSVNIGSYNFTSSTNYTFKVYSSWPNGNPESKFINDTATKNIIACVIRQLYYWRNHTQFH